MCFKAKSDAVLACVRRSEYTPLIKEAVERKTSLFGGVLRKVPLFGLFAPWAVERLAGAVRIAEFARTQAVYAEGESVMYAYIVKEGEFEETKGFSVYSDAEGSPHLRDLIPWKETMSRAGNGIRSRMSTELPILSNSILPSAASPTRSPLKHLRQDVGRRKLKMRTLYFSQLFGEEEIVMGQTTRRTSVHCTSDKGSLYMIRKEPLLSAIRLTGIEDKVGGYVAKNLRREEEATETTAKFVHLELPQVQLLRQRGKGDSPMTERERREMRRKLRACAESKLIRRIRKAIPNCPLDLSYRNYDSRIIRGQEEPPSLLDMLQKPPIRPRVSCPLSGVISSLPKIKSQIVSPERSPPASPRLGPGRKSSTLPHLPPKNRRSQSTFVTAAPTEPASLQVQALVPTCANVRTEAREESPVSGALDKVASEMIEQYKAMNGGSSKISGQDVPRVLGTIVNSSKYIQDLMRSVKRVQDKCAHKMTRSKHNLYRFTSV